MPLDAQDIRPDDRLTILESVDPTFVPYGRFDTIVRLLKAPDIWAPIYIPGPTGVGKTSMVLQACAVADRPVLRYNVTSETDRDHLVGGFRLKNGETVFELGPVARAMRMGAVLLLDEIDLGKPEKLLSLQPVLERKPLFIAEIGERIVPEPGFMIIATANTKGRGTDNGLYIGTNIQNEAFLERFAITIEHGYPETDDEVHILTLLGTKHDPDTLARLVKWANHSRRTFEQTQEGAVISPRRLCFIVRLHEALQGEMEETMELALARFDAQEREPLIELWRKLTPIKKTEKKANPKVNTNYDGMVVSYSQVYKTITITDSAGSVVALQPF